MGKECNVALVARRRNMTPLKTTEWEAKVVARAFYWVAYGQTQSRSTFSLFVFFFFFFFFFFFRVGKSLACHSPGK